MQSRPISTLQFICLAAALSPLACAIPACGCPFDRFDSLNSFPTPQAAATDTAQQAVNVEALRQQAIDEGQAGKADDAMRDFRRALELDPAWKEGRWNLGMLQYEGNQFPAAVETFQKVVAFAPTLGSAWGLLGLSEFETGDYLSALPHLEKAQTLGVDDQDIARVCAYHLGLLLIRDSEFERATALLRTTLGQGTVSAQAKIALGLALLRVPLLPQKLDPSREALVLSAGEAATAAADEPARLAELVRANPSLPYLHYAYGVAVAAAGQKKEARQLLLEETSISPASPLPWIALSNLALADTASGEALSSAERAVEIAPENRDAHTALARALEAAGNLAQAAAERKIADAAVGQPAVAERRIVRFYSNAILEANPGQQDRSLLDRALAEYTAGQYAAAIPDLKATLATTPENGTAWAMLGLCEFALNDFDNALIHLDRGARLGLSASTESLYLARYTYGVLLVHAGEFDRAADVLASAGNASEPLAAKVEFALGLVLLRIAAFPDETPRAQRGLIVEAGSIEALLLKSQYDDALPRLKAALQRYPDTPFLHYAYGTALIALSQFDEAAAQMQAEIAVSPASGLPVESLASIALRQHDSAAAVRWSQRALQLAPGSVRAHYLLGRASLEAGDVPVAVRELETAVRLSPASPEIHFNLAKAYARAKMPEKAQQEREFFSRLSDNKPN
jgi:tetratricopeptide (TPR) repeat protein